MKKILLVMLAVVSASFMNVSAQDSEVLKPADGSFSLEVGFSPFNLGDHSSITLPAGKITGIYSIGNGWGVRLGLGLATGSFKYDDSGVDGIGNDWEKYSASQTAISFAPGFSYSFAGTRRLSPYIGAELVYSTISNKIKYEEDGYKASITNVDVEDLMDELENEGANLINVQMPQTGIGANAFAGFNYYFSKNIYVGAEVGLGFTSYNYKDMVVKEDNITETESNSYKASEFKIYANPQIRLGWAF